MKSILFLLITAAVVASAVAQEPATLNGKVTWSMPSPNTWDTVTMYRATADDPDTPETETSPEDPELGTIEYPAPEGVTIEEHSVLPIDGLEIGTPIYLLSYTKGGGTSRPSEVLVLTAPPEAPGAPHRARALSLVLEVSTNLRDWTIAEVDPSALFVRARVNPIATPEP